MFPLPSRHQHHCRPQNSSPGASTAALSKQPPITPATPLRKPPKPRTSPLPKKPTAPAAMRSERGARRLCKFVKDWKEHCEMLECFPAATQAGDGDGEDRKIRVEAANDHYSLGVYGAPALPREWEGRLQGEGEPYIRGASMRGRCIGMWSPEAPSLYGAGPKTW